MRGSRILVALVAAVLACGAGAKDVVIEEFDVEVDGGQIHGRAAGPKDGRPVLLLHGAAFHSGTWQELGTLAVLADAGFRAVAIDLPGYARSKGVKAKPQAFLAALLTALELDRPVVVSPSMSGSFSWPLVLANPELLSGFVPVAPVRSTEYAKRIKESPLPALVIWGENDRLFPPSQAQLVAASFRDSRTLILPGARHPAYLDQPEKFHEALVEFAKHVSATR
jgi:abhydrolase domain-containing protein 14